MKYRWLIISCLLVTSVATTIMWALYVALDSPRTAPLKLVFVSGGINASWQRTVEGARAAAKDLGIELHVRLPTADDCPDEQANILRTINYAACDGVVFCPADPECQLELVSKIAPQTRLVTIGNYDYSSDALCHVGFSPRVTPGSLARIALPKLPQDAKFALLSSRHSEGNNYSVVDEQLNNFKEQWAEWENCGAPKVYSINLDIDDDSEFKQQADTALSAALNGTDLAFIVALDTPSLEFVLSVFEAHPRTTPIPVIAAFDPTAAILDAVDDGRIYACISQDPYRNGYEGVMRVAKLCRCDVTARPTPGRGSVFIPVQIVQKANLADYRRTDQARWILANRPNRSTKAVGTRAVVKQFRPEEPT